MKCEGDDCKQDQRRRRKRCKDCDRLLCSACFGAPDTDWPVCWECMRRRGDPKPRPRVRERFHDTIIYCQGLLVVGRRVVAGEPVGEPWHYRTGRRGWSAEFFDQQYHGRVTRTNSQST
jgi:hypothetical protein